MAGTGISPLRSAPLIEIEGTIVNAPCSKIPPDSIFRPELPISFSASQSIGILSADPGYGKTLLAIRLALQELQKGRGALYLTSSRIHAEEISNRHHVELGLRRLERLYPGSFRVREAGNPFVISPADLRLRPREILIVDDLSAVNDGTDLMDVIHSAEQQCASVVLVTSRFDDGFADQWPEIMKSGRIAFWLTGPVSQEQFPLPALHSKTTDLEQFSGSNTERGWLLIGKGMPKAFYSRGLSDIAL